MDWNKLIQGIGEFAAGSIIGYFGTQIEDKLIKTVILIPSAYLCLAGADDIINATKPETEKYPEIPENKLNEYREALRLNLIIPKHFDIRSKWEDSNMTVFTSVPLNVRVQYEAYITQELQSVQCYSHLLIAKVNPKPEGGYEIISPYIGIGVNCNEFVLSPASSIEEIGRDMVYQVIASALKGSNQTLDGYYAMALLLSGKKLTVGDVALLLRSGYSHKYLDDFKILGGISTGFKISKW